MRGSDFEFDGVNLLYCEFNKISVNRGGSCIESPKWIKNKLPTINPKNNDYKCFQYAVTLALNQNKIKPSIVLNIFHVSHKTGKIHFAYKSKHNLTREKQVILLMITNGEKWHYLAGKRLSGLLRGDYK